MKRYNRNLLGGLYRENPVKSRNYEAVKSSKKWENVGNSYIIPALLLYRYSYIWASNTSHFIFSISVLSHSNSLAVYTFSVISEILCPTIYLIAYSSTLASLHFVTKCFLPSWGLWSGLSLSSSRMRLNILLYRLYVNLVFLPRRSSSV